MINEELEFFSDGEERLDRFLAEKMPDFSRSKLAKLITDGHVFLDGEPAKSGTKLRRGQRISLEAPSTTPPHDLTPSDMPLDVLFEDDSLLVINKPRGLATHPAASLHSPSLVNALLGRGGALSGGSAEWRPGIVHRLDKETTGLILVAKTDQAHAHLASQIQIRSAERKYVAVVGGVAGKKPFTIDAPIGRDPKNRLRMAVEPKGKSSITYVRPIGIMESGTVLELRLATGRTHQIRVHLSAVGNPVLGDELYAPKEFLGIPLQLHAVRITFEHPVSGERLSFFCPPPMDFVARDLVIKDNSEQT